MARTPAPDTRDRILSVASRLFYAHGVRAVGMNQIITEAATGKNVLYRHFPAKTDLVAAYLEDVHRRRTASGRRALDAAGDDPRDRLVAVVAEVARTVRRPGFRGCAFRNYLAEFPDAPAAGGPGVDDPPGHAPTEVARTHLAESRATLARLVAELDVEEPDRLVEQLWLLVDGLYLQAAYRDRLDGVPAGDAAVELAHDLVHG